MPAPDRPREGSAGREPEAAAAGAGSNGVAAASAARRELRDFQRAHEQRRRQLPRAIVVGLVVGLVAVAFRECLRGAEKLRFALVDFAWAHLPLGPLLPVLVGAAGAAFAVYVVRRFAPEASGSGIPHVKAVLYGTRELRRRILPVKFFGGVAGIGGGLVMGREGPTIQMGAVVGHMVAGWFPSTPREKRTLIAAGAGAGLAAAFNAPLAGLVFVLEEVQRDFSPAVFSATLIASAVADVTTRLLLGQLPVFHVATDAMPALSAVPVALVLGVLAAGLGVAFNRALVGSLDAYAAIRSAPAWAVAGLAGAAVGAVGLWMPAALGGGDTLVEQILVGQFRIVPLVGLFVLRFALTMTSYGTGAPGGIFAPLLMLGSALGLVVGKTAAILFPATIDHPEVFAVVGMAAYFAAIVRAPLTGVVLMVEMTGNYGLVLPLMAASLSAYGIADYLGDRPVYDALLHRDIARGHDGRHLDGTLLLDLTIAPRSRWDGATVAGLDLPAGCLVILRRRGLAEDVPLPATELAAGDQVSVLVAADAADAVGMLHEAAGVPLPA